MLHAAKRALPRGEGGLCTRGGCGWRTAFLPRTRGPCGRVGRSSSRPLRPRPWRRSRPWPRT
eukprot:4318292-Lingulodinium_polyedra.AAC.1